MASGGADGRSRADRIGRDRSPGAIHGEDRYGVAHSIRTGNPISRAMALSNKALSHPASEPANYTHSIYSADPIASFLGGVPTDANLPGANPETDPISYGGFRSKENPNAPSVSQVMGSPYGAKAPMAIGLMGFGNREGYGNPIGAAMGAGVGLGGSMGLGGPGSSGGRSGNISGRGPGNSNPGRGGGLGAGAMGGGASSGSISGRGPGNSNPGRGGGLSGGAMSGGGASVSGRGPSGNPGSGGGLSGGSMSGGGSGWGGGGGRPGSERF